jgi:hypothetical protein
MSTATATKPAATDAAKAKDDSVLAGLVPAPTAEATPTPTPKPARRSRKATAKAATPAPNPEKADGEPTDPSQPVRELIEDGKVAAAEVEVVPDADPEDAADPDDKVTVKASKAAAKRDLATYLLNAYDTAFYNLEEDNPIFQAYSREEAARIAAQWVHHLPPPADVEGNRVWPCASLPRPDRSDWR